jgi:uncharacterized protein
MMLSMSALVEDLIYHEELLHMETITHHHFTNRFGSIRFAYPIKSYQLAKKNGKLDARATARGRFCCMTSSMKDRDAVAPAESRFPMPMLIRKIACEKCFAVSLKISSLERDIILKHMFFGKPFVALPALQRKFLS